MPGQHCTMNMLFQSSRCEGEIWEHSFLRDNGLSGAETQNTRINGLMMVLSISLMMCEIRQKMKKTVSKPFITEVLLQGQL